jgi:hypothetical protein
MRAIGDDWATITIHVSAIPTLREIVILAFLEDHYEIDSITVIDRTYENLYPLVAALVIGVAMLVGVVLRALRERRQG